MPRCPQCNGLTKAGQRCKNLTCKFAPKCRLHTQVSVGQSTIANAGRGLFARDDLRKNDIVGDYTHGTRAMTREMFQSHYPDGRASHVALIQNTYYDASDGNRSVAGMANRASGPLKNNAKINKNGKLVITRNIRKGNEIFLSYGNSYRIN